MWLLKRNLSFVKWLSRYKREPKGSTVKRQQHAVLKLKIQHSADMSLDQEEIILKRTQQNEASGKQQQETADQTRHEPSQAFDAESRSSNASTRHSYQSSSTASSATKAYTKAKAAQAQLAYAEREGNLMKQRAYCDASLHLLQYQRTAAAAEAEAMA